jgi:antitoxin (DNA-binding transcriptional repressor) of toxin-antitoxin stability system
MNTITIRQVRQHWPEVERRLATEGELTITRDASPVARLCALSPPKHVRRKRFSAEMHARWMKEIWGLKPPRLSSGQLLDDERRERFTKTV